MATYPAGIINFPTHVDLTEIIYAAVANNIQNEVQAIESTLGVNPQGTYATVLARIVNIETNYSLTSHNHAHDSLTGVAASTAHTAYQLLSTYTTKGDVVVATGAATTIRLGVGTNGQVLLADSTQASGLRWGAAAASVTIDATASDYTTSAVGDTTSAGATGLAADAGHRHGREVFAGTVQPLVSGGSGTVGTATSHVHSDHVHATPVAAPVTQAFGDAATTGSTGNFSDAGHRHGMPALAGTGTATTGSHSDHTHTSSKTLRMDKTFALSGAIIVPGNTNYPTGTGVVPPFSVSTNGGTQTLTIQTQRFFIEGGTSVTFNITRTTSGGTVTTLATGLVATTTRTTGTALATALSDLDEITIVVTAVSGSPYGLTVTLFIDYAF